MVKSKNTLEYLLCFCLSFCLCLCLIAPAYCADKHLPKRFMDMDEKAIDKILADTALLDRDKRLQILSAHFLQTPYKLNPLGEGNASSVDNDPQFRLDAVDCITFLEQLWGMTNALSLESAKLYTQQIRYKAGIIDYQHRLHFTWSQWLFENERSGFIKDITKELAGMSTLSESKTVSIKQCTGKWESFCKSLGSFMPQGKFTRDIMPLDFAIQNHTKIPSSFLFIVLTDRKALPYRIKHAGLVIKINGKLYLRHASTVHKSVVDVLLITYLKMLKTKNMNWKASGLIIVSPQIIDSQILKALETKKTTK